MLSGPFRGMGRGRLVLILIVLLIVEAAGGLGLYVNNRHASAAPTTAPSARPPVAARPAVQPVHRFPRAVVVGRSEIFSVRLPDLANKQVTYVISYPDGSAERAPVQTDASGFSQHVFRIAANATAPRGPIGVGVYYEGQKRAYAQFAVQLPIRTVRP